MMMGVVSIFLVCWLPYHTYFIIANLYPAINYSHYIQVIIIMMMMIILIIINYSRDIQVIIILRIITAIKNISQECLLS